MRVQSRGSDRGDRGAAGAPPGPAREPGRRDAGRPFCACAARLAPPWVRRTRIPPNLKARFSGPTGSGGGERKSFLPSRNLRQGAATAGCAWPREAATFPPEARPPGATSPGRPARGGTATGPWASSSARVGSGAAPREACEGHDAHSCGSRWPPRLAPHSSSRVRPHARSPSQTTCPRSLSFYWRGCNPTY